MGEKFSARVSPVVRAALTKWRRPGADLATIERVQRELGVTLPDDLVAFYLDTNGLSGEVGESALELEPVEGISARTDDYDFRELAPDYLLLGTNGGSEGYALDRRDGRIVIIPLINPAEANAILQGSFCQFFERVAADTQFD